MKLRYCYVGPDELRHWDTLWPKPIEDGLELSDPDWHLHLQHNQPEEDADTQEAELAYDEREWCEKALKHLGITRHRDESYLKAWQRAMLAENGCDDNPENRQRLVEAMRDNIHALRFVWALTGEERRAASLGDPAQLAWYINSPIHGWETLSEEEVREAEVAGRAREEREIARAGRWMKRIDTAWQVLPGIGLLAGGVFALVGLLWVATQLPNWLGLGPLGGLEVVVGLWLLLVSGGLVALSMRLIGLLRAKSRKSRGH